MRYLEINDILKANKLFQRLQEKTPGVNIELEAYSCKETHKEKKNIKVKKPLRYLLLALQLRYPDYDFSNDTWASFSSRELGKVRTEIAYGLTIAHKNIEDVKEFVDFLTIIINQVVDLQNSEIYSYDRKIDVSEEYDWHLLFLFYNKQGKRIIILTATSSVLYSFQAT